MSLTNDEDEFNWGYTKPQPSEPAKEEDFSLILAGRPNWRFQNVAFVNKHTLGTSHLQFNQRRLTPNDDLSTILSDAYDCADKWGLFIFDIAILFC